MSTAVPATLVERALSLILDSLFIGALCGIATWLLRLEVVDHSELIFAVYKIGAETLVGTTLGNRDFELISEIETDSSLHAFAING
ncbi:hypothetical protein WG915_03115 [Corynebacterium sp. H128]|uniref:hypothetical protein n=1 Tax=Corynebacterium sp. H128 TaxID=3133427 RepID=UPI0030A6E4D5